MDQATQSNPFDRLGDVTRVTGFGALGANDQAFLQRMYTGDAGRYLTKLRSVGLVGRRRVLDLGCGFGQWSLCMATMNDAVVAVDVEPDRVAVVDALATQGGFANIETHPGTGEAIPVDDGSVDAIFCFGVLQFLDTGVFLDEVVRVLAPGGVMYVTGKDVGGYLYFWKERPNQTPDYDPREYAADAFANTFFLEHYGTLFPERRHDDRIVTCDALCAAAEQAGLHTLARGPEGSIAADGYDGPCVNFFTTEYDGYPKAYEVLLERPA